MKKTYIFCGFTKEKKFGNKMSAYLKNDMKEIIRDANGIVIGISAGAINLGKISVCSKDTLKGIEKTSIYKGIGRIEYTFEPHFNMKSDFELNPELKYISSRIKLYVISNDIEIKILDNKYEVVEGNMYIIENKNVKEIGEFDRCC